jgi:hypothetical protein
VLKSLVARALKDGSIISSSEFSVVMPCGRPSSSIARLYHWRQGSLIDELVPIVGHVS